MALRRILCSSLATTPALASSRLPSLNRAAAAIRTPIRSMAESAGDFKLVQIQRGETPFNAYVTGKENAPGIVVLQEWWGVDFEIKNHALHVAKLDPGYRVLIPDLYRGKVALDVAEAQHLMEDLDWKGAIEDIRASVHWLKNNGSKKVGVTGYCLGGALSVASTVGIPEVDAVVSFYGVPPSEVADPSNAKAPVQAHFGELDSFVGFSDVTAAKGLEEKLKLSGNPYEVFIYPGCGHAFMNRSPEGIKRRKEMGITDDNQDAVDLAWFRFKAWMARFLHP